VAVPALPEAPAAQCLRLPPLCVCLLLCCAGRQGCVAASETTAAIADAAESASIAACCCTVCCLKACQRNFRQIQKNQLWVLQCSAQLLMLS
jgi:hypothetical protein